MPDKQLVCKVCHDRCEEILKLRIGGDGEHPTLGMKQARQKNREPGYYDGLIDGINEAIMALNGGGFGVETGLYWAKLRERLKEETTDVGHD